MTAPRIQWLSPDDPPDAFADPATALASPNGLLSAGGDLAPERLLYAYEHGIFPWFEPGQPILWWSPDPRCVLAPSRFHLARRLRRSLRRSALTITWNRAFDKVIVACSRRRGPQFGTWITPAMVRAYSELHRLGWAHSVEVWQEERLVGGVYGPAIGRAFFGESMFSGIRDASKVALLALCRHLDAQGFRLLDCQVASPHLLSLGAELLGRREFMAALRAATLPRKPFVAWPRESIPVAALVALR